MLEENSAVSLAFYGPKEVLQKLHLAHEGRLSERGHWSREWRIEPNAAPETVIARADQFIESNLSELIEALGS